MTPPSKTSGHLLPFAALPLLWSAAAVGQTFPGVDSARISVINGVPQLQINGAPTPPLVFFYNNEAGPGTPGAFATQVAEAAKNGVHIYSTIIHWEWGSSVNWAFPDSEFQRYIDIDPQAMFLVRLRSDPPGNWTGFASAPAGSVVKFQDGSLDTSNQRLSWGSAYYKEQSTAALRNFVRHYESNAIGRRIIGYHLAGGSSGEWFGFGGFDKDYRVAGPDYSDANLQAFRDWLRQKYGTDAQLQQAWGTGANLATAAIPVNLGRFPVRDRQPVVAFYSRPGQQDWIDFSAFESDLASQWILDLARVVKQETNGLKLTAAFYGYTYEAFAPSLMAHSRLDRLLDSPDLDILCAPISYQQSGANSYPDRWLGGPAGFMSAVDSVAAHGKLWFNENDILSFTVPDTSFDFANRILQRDLGSVLIHRAGTWWMDLFATGPFVDPRLWTMMGSIGVQNYRNLYAAPKPYQPEVAVISDAISHLYVGNDTAVPGHNLMLLKNYVLKAGVSAGFYTLDDFIAGIAPKCLVYIMANANYLTDAQIAAIRQRLDREGALVIWQYAPGFLGPSSSNASRTSTVAGMTIVQADGVTLSSGLGILDGKVWGNNSGAVVSPRLSVQDASATSLGRYADGKISTAQKRVGSHTSIFAGDLSLSADFIRTIARTAGVHVWTTDDSIVHTDGSLLVVHSGVAGTKKINLPPGVTAQPMSGQLAGQDASSISAVFAAGDTRWFKLSGPLTITAPAEGQVVPVSNVTISWTEDVAATGYDIRIQRTGGGTMFSGQLAGSGSVSTVIELPSGAYTAQVRPCTGGGFTTCGTGASRGFSVQLPAPASSPQIVSPANGAILTASTSTLSWTAVAGAGTYRVTLRNLTTSTIDLEHTVVAPEVSTVFSMKGGQYSLEVRACTAACGPPGTSGFAVNLPPVPAAAPVVNQCQVANQNNQNSIVCGWSVVAGADLYVIQVVQPAAGPGGGALTVASRQVSQTTATLLAPNGAAVAFVAACNGNGCGPNSAGTPVNPGFGNPAQPVVAQPVGGLTVDGPNLTFAWSRIPGDNGSNTVYRLYIQDFSRQQPALDVLTTNNFYGALFNSGRRYDAVVIANPNGAAPNQGPPQGFATRGASPSTPTLVSPAYDSQQPPGNVALAWTPLPGAELYQYYLSGKLNPDATGVTSGIRVQVPLTGGGTVYNAIIRVCAAGSTCAAGSETGWGPWSNTPGGSGALRFKVVP